MTRKTDNLQTHNPIHMNLVVVSAIYVFGSLLLAVLILMLKYSQDMMEKSSFMCSLFNITTCFLKNCSSIFTTIFYYILLLSAFQRFSLMINAKMGARMMTGRRLIFNISISYPFAIISAMNKIMDVDKVPWLEVVVMGLTLIMFVFNTSMVKHIERRSVVLVHITVLVQTAPIFVLLMFFTILKMCVITTNQTIISTWTFQTLMASSMSLATPFFLIIGSWAKRRIVFNLITCQWNESAMRGTVYTPGRTPSIMSNAVSMTPTRF